MRQICERLLQGANRDADLENFWKSQVLFVMLAATDGHAKNFSIQIQAGGSFALTPIYDVLSAWPIIGSGANLLAWQDARLAMAFRGKNTHYNLAGILRRHLLATAERDCSIPVDQAELLLDQIIARTPAAIEEVSAMLPRDFPSAVSDAIFRGLTESVRRIGE
jgi:serine/threonine-protein kinase HipA